MIKPIETIYNGYRFRSRLEARWAVFHDAAGIDYRYEYQGYEAEDGTSYLPDFYLPELDTHAEVKPNTPEGIRELEKAVKMIRKDGPIKQLVVLSDIPGPCKDGGLWHFPCFYWGCTGVVCGWFFYHDLWPACSGNVSKADYAPAFYIDQAGKLKPLYPDNELNISAMSDAVLQSLPWCTVKAQLCRNERIFEAFAKASQARFEYGG